MNYKLVEILRAECPLFFRKPISIECLDGWFWLLLDTCRRLEALCANQLTAGKSVMVAVQVKQKYGALCIYVDDAPDAAHGVIADAEDASETVCEICAGNGSLRDGTWLWTLCDTHYREYRDSLKGDRGDA